MRRTVIPFLAVLLLAVGLAGPSEAQRSLLFRDLKLSEGDLDMLSEAGNRAYETGTPGSTADWTNQETGNSGTARLIQTFERDGLPCRRIEHLITMVDRADPTQVVFDTCRDTDGVWKLI